MYPFTAAQAFTAALNCFAQAGPAPSARCARLQEEFCKSAYACQLLACRHAYNDETPSRHHPEDDTLHHTGAALAGIRALTQDESLSEPLQELLWLLGLGHDFGKIVTRQLDPIQRQVHFPHHFSLSLFLFHDLLIEAGLAEAFAASGLLYPLYLAMTLHLESLHDLYSSYAPALAPQIARKWQLRFSENPSLVLPMLAINFGDEYGRAEAQERATYCHYETVLAGLDPVGTPQAIHPREKEPGVGALERTLSQEPAILIAAGIDPGRDLPALVEIVRSTNAVLAPSGAASDRAHLQALFAALDSDQSLLLYSPDYLDISQRGILLNRLQEIESRRRPLMGLTFFSPIRASQTGFADRVGRGKRCIPAHFGEQPAINASTTYDRIFAGYWNRSGQYDYAEYVASTSALDTGRIPGDWAAKMRSLASL
jgi:hypothetical protein